MTDAGIEESRQWLKRFVRLNGSDLNDVELNAADGFIDRLCAAAREPESLVGKRVRVSGECDGRHIVHHGAVIAERITYSVELPTGTFGLDRDDFELLEGDDAE